jgi:hypothetical protein
MRPMSRLFVRWFIVDVCAKKAQSFTSPYVGRTGTDVYAGRILVDLTKNIMCFASSLVFETYRQNRLRIAKQIHYALDVRLCVYGFLLNASRMELSLRWV